MSTLFALSAKADRAALVVSVHDVAPSTKTRVEEIVAELAHHGVAVCSLLVVPDYHHRGCFSEDRAFVRWLQDLETRGHEIVIHGYFHQRPRRPGEKLLKQAVTRFYTSDEGEFYDLDYEEALRRINQAREQFAASGLSPRGFIAPAWLLSRAAEQAAADAEMEYTTRLTHVHDLRGGESYRARSLVYSVRSGWRRQASLAWNSVLARRLADAPLARVSLHPPDRDHSEIWRQALRLIDCLLEDRTATTYRDWIAEKRVQQRG